MIAVSRDSFTIIPSYPPFVNTFFQSFFTFFDSFFIPFPISCTRTQDVVFIAVFLCIYCDFRFFRIFLCFLLYLRFFRSLQRSLEKTLLETFSAHKNFPWYILVNNTCPPDRQLTQKDVEPLKRIRWTTVRYIVGILLVIFFNLFIIALVTDFQGMRTEPLAVLSKVGSQGDEVRAIQQKLNDLGYGLKVDGIYGAATKKAVRSFQKANGLTADGIAGSKTLKALGVGAGNSGGSGSSADTSPIGSFSSNDISLLARIISAESRGEPYEGQVAVGAVILNRIEHPSFPNTLAGVIYQPGAFSCLNDGGVNAAVADSAYRAARDAINGNDPSGGAIYYYNPDKSTSKWIFSRPVITVIGKHRFCS